MKKRILLFTSILVLVVNFICVGTTYSWFTVTNSVSAEYLQTGMLNFKMYGEFIGKEEEIELVVPGDQLIQDKLYLTNQSTVDSSVKIKVEAYLKETPEDANPKDAASLLELTFDSVAGDSWEKDATLDNVWYYKTSENSQIIKPSPDTPTTMGVIKQVKLKEEVTQEDAGKFLVIKVTFYARQAKYMEWNTIAETEYETTITTP